MNYITEQEEFWAGSFGNEYIKRNQGQQLISSKLALFKDIFTHMDHIGSCLELGSNIGLNLQAIRLLISNIKLSAVEINAEAVQDLKKMSDLEVFHQSILDFASDKQWDLTFTSGVLIHICPDRLQQVYEALYKNSKRYIMIAEYYNPVPVEVLYRGNQGKLFKRDFCGEILDKYRDLRLIDYGFCYHRDNLFPMDDVNWFLMEKRIGK